jgi:hypothetical protein
LDAQAHLDLAVAPDLAHPDHLVDAASLGNVAAAHQLPRPVAAVIVQLDLLAVAPQSVAGGGVERSSLAAWVDGALAESARRASWTEANSAVWTAEGRPLEWERMERSW